MIDYVTNEYLINCYNQTKNNEYVEMLWNKNTPLIRKVAIKYNLQFQDFSIPFMETIKTYKIKYKFSTMLTNNCIWYAQKYYLDKGKQKARETTLNDNIVADTSKYDFKDDILNGIKHLNEIQKYIILAYYYDNKTQYNIAKELNISQPHCGRLLKQALSRLKDLLGGDNYL